MDVFFVGKDEKFYWIRFEYCFHGWMEREREIFVLFSGKTFIVCGFFDLILSIEKSYIFC